MAPEFIKGLWGLSGFSVKLLKACPLGSLPIYLCIYTRINKSNTISYIIDIQLLLRLVQEQEDKQVEMHMIA